MVYPAHGGKPEWNAQVNFDLVERLACPCCRDERSPLNAIPFLENGKAIVDGVLVCPACRAWYPIQDALLELVVPPLLDLAGLAPFLHAYAKELAAANCPVSPLSAPAAHLDAQAEQRKYFDWYAENEQLNYAVYQNTPFWRAEDLLVFSEWKTKATKSDGWLLDIGSADGRSTFQWAEIVKHVVGCDISKKMIRHAIERARHLGTESRMSFFVADADSLPLRSGSFDYACTYGVLHHLPNPGKTYGDLIRVLGRGGIFFAAENNKSAFRGVFDVLMRMFPLWTELAGEEPLISLRMFRDWSQGLPVVLSTRNSVFIPPHLLNLAGYRLAGPLLRLTDCVFRHIPWFQNQGGVIIVESHKQPD